MSTTALRVLGIALACAATSGACGDPVHDNEVAALGPEAPGVSPGPMHRPGQPCLVCHGGSGPASTQFVFAGTVYEAQPLPATPLNGGQITVTDSNLSAVTVPSNSAGNFFVTSSQWTPVFPLACQVSYQSTSAQMTTHVGRDGSCATCHYDPPSASTPGHLYLVETPADFPGASP